MASLFLFGATTFLWVITLFSFSTGGGYLLCSFLPLAIGMTYVSARVAGARRSAAGGFHLTRTYNETVINDYSLPDQFRILNIGDGYVDFEHPEGGGWSYGISEDIRAVNGVEMVESMGGWRYRLHVSRNSMNAAQVLEAAYHFRTEPKVTKDGIVDLNSCPGYDILYQEAINDLD